MRLRLREPLLYRWLRLKRVLDKRPRPASELGTPAIRRILAISCTALGFERFFHDPGETIEPWEVAGQGDELLIGSANPNVVQLRDVAHHARHDGIRFTDAFGGKLLHVLVDFGGQSAEIVHGHPSPASL